MQEKKKKKKKEKKQRQKCIRIPTEIWPKWLHEVTQCLELVNEDIQGKMFKKRIDWASHRINNLTDRNLKVKSKLWVCISTPYI